MTQATDIFNQFNAGELSPLMEGRLDFAKVHNGCRTLENFIPTVQGPAKRRQGSRYVATTKNLGQKVWLRPFQASNIEQYVLEFGDHYIRFYTNHGILLGGSGPYEVSTPYSSAELTDSEGLCRLQMTQSNDVLFIVHASHPPAKLSRVGVGTFTFTEGALGISATGPFKDLNANEAITISATGDGVDITEAGYDISTGILNAPSIQLEASTGIFTDGMVGKYFYLQEGKNILVSQWEPAKAISPADRRRSDSINYMTAAGGTTGTVKPIHLSGTRFDGNTGVQWTFTDDGSGVVLITELIGAQPTSKVKATVVKRLPYSITQGPGGSTHRWAAQAWTADDGYPDSICFFRERLAFGRGQTLWFTVAGDFTDFSTTIGGLVTADAAIIATVGADHKDRIQWLQPDTELLVGTASSEYAVSEYSNGQPFGPANIKAQIQTADGSRALKPIKVGAANLFVQVGGLLVREMSYDIRQAQYMSVDVTILSEHITRVATISPPTLPNQLDGILDWTFAKRPDRVIWGARADGILLGFTYNREQDVTAWHRHKIGYQTDGGGAWGRVESVCAIANPNGTQDDLWMVVKRGANRHVEWIGEPLHTDLRNTPWGGGQIHGILNEVYLPWQTTQSLKLWELDSFYVDGGLSRLATGVYEPVNNPPNTVTEVHGLEHLENLTVQVVTDGSPHKDKIVTNGRITLDWPAFTVHVGCKAPAVLETTQINIGAQDGSAQGKVKRIHKITARLHQSKGGSIGPDRKNQELIQFRRARERMDDYIEFETGDKLQAYPGAFENDSRIYVRQDSAFPMTVVALIPNLVTREGA